MEKQTQYIVVGVALVTLFLIFGVSLMSSNFTPVEEPLDDLTGDDSSMTDETPSIGEGVIASRTYTGGTHIYAGVVALPTPCHGVETDVTVAESFPEQVSINLVVTQPAEGQMCAQVVTPRLFTAEFSASEEAIVRVFRDGEPVAVQLVEELPPLQ